jgi:hypothetical protein
LGIEPVTRGGDHVISRQLLELTRLIGDLQQDALTPSLGTTDMMT